ncbi:MAG: HD domain-containing protein [Planctomycetes bacterium]|nr:HD domain-containing protein [Planctomycetota bacterium]
MRLPSKPAWLLIGVHTLCLSIGFWFLFQLVMSSTEYFAAESARDLLAVHSRKLTDAAHGIDAFDPANLQQQELLQRTAREVARVSPTGAVLVDQNWNVVNVLSTTGLWNIGDHLQWESERAGTEGIQRGQLKSATGNRPAIALPLRQSSVRMVVYDHNPVNQEWRAVLVTSLPLAAGIAFFWTWILSSVSTYLLSARLSSEESHRMAQSEHDALRSAQDLLRTRDAVIFGLAKLAESRDPETGHHLERISLYSTRLATALRLLPKYHRVVTPGFIRLLGISSVLHDIGKVGLEDTVLLKPGRLNADERRKMQEHTLVAGECLKEIEQRLGASNFLQTAREIALHHHERWDGNGYPAGLAGESIPLAARIVTVADVYDALSSKRVYKDAFPHEECVRLIREGSGTQFDPELVTVFLSIEADFAAIGQRFAAQAAASIAAAESCAVADSLMTAEQESVLIDVVSTPKPCAESPEVSSSVA